MKATYVNHYLTDRDIANFARQSFAKLADNFTEEQNNKLIHFLARGMSSGDWGQLIEDMGVLQTGDEAKELAVYIRKIPEHWVPFGHPQITLRMQAPIPIRVQCFKHKIGFVESEESRRYISTRPEVFVPNYFRAKAQNVKQGSASTPAQLSEPVYSPTYQAGEDRPGFLRTVDPVEVYRGHCEHSIRLYERFIKDGVCPEQARFILPQGCEVKWVWTGSLYAFANFYNQRSDSHAQKEIQELADQVDKIIDPLFPVAWKALTRGEY
jgi:thymidylate synthase (FAD)